MPDLNLFSHFPIAGILHTSFYCNIDNLTSFPELDNRSSHSLKFPISTCKTKELQIKIKRLLNKSLSCNISAYL